MTDADHDKWKSLLRTEMITSMTGTEQDCNKAYTQIGYYYNCYAPLNLYKYYSDQSHNFEAVRNNKVWYSAPCNFNDVFDCDISINEQKIFKTTLQMVSGSMQIHAGSPAWYRLKQEIKDWCRKLQSVFDNLKEAMGIACFSELNDSLLMWAHYANNHQGMCVEYNLLDINKKLRFTPVPIIYSDKKTNFCSLSQETVEVDSLRCFIESLTSKSQEWHYEKEWRIIREEEACGVAWNPDKKGALLDMIQPTSIFLGCMCKASFEKDVREYCEKNRINLFKMEKDKEEYRLNKAPILQFDE